MKIIHRNDAIHTRHTRDAALNRLRQANRWMIAGSAALTGVLADAAANAFPGHTVTRGSTRGTAAEANSTTKQLAPPAQAPRGATTTEGSESSPAETQTPQQREPAETQTPQSGEAPHSEPSASAEEAHAPEATPSGEAGQPAQEASPPVEERPEPVVSGGS